MANLQPEVVREVHVGDSGRLISHSFLQATRVQARVLTGYGAWAIWAYVNAAPHVVRAATVLGASGVVRYETVGDEFTQEGEVLLRFRITHPDYYGNGATARGFIATSSPLIKFIVMKRPGT